MELRKNIKSCNINQGLMISHSQLTVIYKNDIYKSDTCVASFPGSPGTRKCIGSIYCTFHVTKNTRLSTPAQLQCSHSRVWEPGNEAMIHVQCSLISRPPQGLIISHSQLTVIYKNDRYKSDTCVVSFSDLPRFYLPLAFTITSLLFPCIIVNANER